VRTYLPKQEVCPDCGGKLKHLGEDVSERLEIEPLRFKVIRQVRPKLALVFDFRQEGSQIFGSSRVNVH